MPEAGRPPQTHYAATPRRRRSSFRRHRTCCRALKWCCQSGAARYRRSDVAEAQSLSRLHFSQSNGYSMLAASRLRAPSERVRSTAKRCQTLRRQLNRRCSRPCMSSGWHLLPQNASHSLCASFRPRSQRKTAPAAAQPALAAPHKRSARRQLRDRRRFRPTRTKS